MDPATSQHHPCLAVIDFCRAILSLNHDDLVDSVMNRLSFQDLDEIFRTMRTRCEGRLKLNRTRSKRTWLHGLSPSSETCRSLCNNSFSKPKALIPVRFTMCSSPGSLDNLGQMTAVFNSEFSEAFMLIVLPLDLRPTPRLTAKSGVEWPQLVSDKLKKKCTVRPPPSCNLKFVVFVHVPAGRQVLRPALYMTIVVHCLLVWCGYGS